jgi:hypothetical protein
MLRIASVALVALVTVVVAGCKDKPAEPPPPPAAEVTPAHLDRGKAVIGTLKSTLVGALTQAMAEGAPAAITVCNTEAPKLAAALSTEGVTVGRATRKPRNPKNAAAGWQADALAHFEQLATTKTPLAGTSFSRRLADGRVAYAEPLVIQELCVPCHGTAIAPDVQAVLAEKYPADQATGYAVGDLRGVAWAELPAN